MSGTRTGGQKPSQRMTLRHQETITITPEGREALVRWIEADLGEGWTVAARMITREGRPDVAEMRIFPTPKTADAAAADRALGSWDQDDTTVPVGGLSAVLRGVPLTVLKEREHQVAQELGLVEAILDQPLPRTPRRPGRKGHSIEEDAQFAAIYVKELAQGQKGVRARVAARMGTGYTADYVRKRIHRCRGRGLLTPTTGGRAGGALTPLALAALRRRAEGSR